MGFNDDLIVPDHSTLNRFRHWLAKDNTLEDLLAIINQQLVDKGKLHVTPANARACKHFEVLLDDVDDGVLVHADKGYSRSENRQHLVKRGLRDGLMHKANRGQALTAAQKAKNKQDPVSYFV